MLISFCLGVKSYAEGWSRNGGIDRVSPPLCRTDGQLVLAGCYDNVSRIIIYSTINFSSIKCCSAGPAGARLGQTRREYQVISPGSHPIYSKGKYIIIYTVIGTNQSQVSIIPL